MIYKRITIQTPVVNRTKFNIDELISDEVNDKIEKLMARAQATSWRIINADSVIDSRSFTDPGISSIITVIHLEYSI